MKPTHLSRRTFLRGTGVSLALPFLEAMIPLSARAAATAQVVPRRFVAINIPLGFLSENFFPAESGAGYKASPYLKIGESLRDQFTVFSGVSHPGVDGGHETQKSFLTAAPHPAARSFKNSVSVDQVIAKVIGAETRFSSITLGEHSLGVSENGVGVPRIGMPGTAYRKLFMTGTPQEVAREIAEIKRVLPASGATEIRVSKDEAQRLLYWSGRKAAFPAVGRISPDYYCIDGTIPRKALPRVLRAIAQWSQEYGLPCANVFHAGDGNLHPLILFDANKPGETERTVAFGDRILELCIEVGGTVTGEHGVGVEKLNTMCLQFTPEELARFHGVKEAFDAYRLLNPGKAVPTLHRCAEMGKMHVHHGALPHPDLPRF